MHNHFVKVRASKEAKNTIRGLRTRLFWVSKCQDIAADPASLYKFQSNAGSYEPKIDPSHNEFNNIYS